MNKSYRGRSGRSFSGGNKYRSSNSSRSRGGNRGRNRSRKSTKRLNPAMFVKQAQPIEQTTYTPSNKFSDFQLHENIQSNLNYHNFDSPTEIQDKSIPVAMSGADLVGIANTGTGKTAAFLLPILNSLMKDNKQKALIIAPTRELANQIEQEFRKFSFKCNLYSAVLIGGAPIFRQFKQLERHPSVVIGTPGRIMDHIKRGSLKLDGFETVVLDEFDRMLDMGFINDIKDILNQMPSNKHSMFFSATSNKTVLNIVDSLAVQVQVVNTKSSETSGNVEQTVEKYQYDEERSNRLYDILNQDHVEKIVIFRETKRNVERLHRDLEGIGYRSASIHGDKNQRQRQRALKAFREDKVDILVATDVASRGIDVKDVTHVINFDEPESFEDYTHRIGRAGRSNNIGYAITFVKS